MRIIGGDHGGRMIAAPKGVVSRPTAARAREAIFNILTARAEVDFASARVIDLFAGSGALGLEAMSRGAPFCLFVETDHAARGAIRDNLEALGLTGRARLHRRSASDLGHKPAGLGGAFALAFLDPPYGKGLAAPALAALRDGAWLAAGATVVVETGKGEDAPYTDGYGLLDEREYGAARIAVLRRDG